MVACTHSNAQAVEQGSDVEMMDVAHIEGNDSSATVQFDSLYLPHLLNTVLGKLVLMGSNVFNAQLLDIVDGCGKTMGGNIIRCSCLEFERQAFEGSVFPRYTINHLSPTLIGWQTVEPLLFSIKHSDARRAIHFVTAEGKKITIEGLYINALMRCALCSVYHHGNTIPMSEFDDLGNRVDGTEHVAHMGDTHQTRSFVEQLFEGFKVEAVVVFHWNHPHLDSFFLRLQLPRNYV